MRQVKGTFCRDIQFHEKMVNSEIEISRKSREPGIQGDFQNWDNPKIFRDFDVEIKTKLQ